MDTHNQEVSKQSKPKTKLRTENLRVRKETKKKILSELAVLNKKEFGRPITPDDYVAMAVSLLEPQHLEALKERSLSNKDKLEKRYQEYCSQHGKITKDEFIGVLLSQGTKTFE
jgi:hypothetical protein